MSVTLSKDLIVKLLHLLLMQLNCLSLYLLTLFCVWERRRRIRMLRLGSSFLHLFFIPFSFLRTPSFHSIYIFSPPPPFCMFTLSSLTHRNLHNSSSSLHAIYKWDTEKERRRGRRESWFEVFWESEMNENSSKCWYERERERRWCRVDGEKEMMKRKESGKEGWRKMLQNINSLLFSFWIRNWDSLFSFSFSNFSPLQVQLLLLTLEDHQESNYYDGHHRHPNHQQQVENWVTLIVVSGEWN